MSCDISEIKSLSNGYQLPFPTKAIPHAMAISPETCINEWTFPPVQNTVNLFYNKHPNYRSIGALSIYIKLLTRFTRW